MNLSKEARMIAGIVAITVPTVEFGGVFLLGMIDAHDPGYLENAVRGALFRAGHAHAGVLMLLSLIVQVLADSARLGAGWLRLARLGAPIAAILMPLGFFVSVAHPAATTPNGWIALVYAGAFVLAASLVTLGVGLVRAARVAAPDSGL